METTVESLFSFYIFTTGRRLFALRQVRATALKHSFAALVDHCDAAIAHDLATRQLERRWSSQPAPAAAAGNPEARKIDILVDQTLVALRDGAVTQTRGAAPDDPVHDNVKIFLERAFVVPVPELIKFPFVEELAAVEDLVVLLHGELATYVKELGLGRLAKRLAELAKQYKEALDAAPPSLLDWGRVRAGRAEGQALLLEAVCIILGKYHARTPAVVALREELLAPIRRQNDAIGLYLRSHRTVGDVNADTGEEEGGDGTDPQTPPGNETGPGDKGGDGAPGDKGGAGDK
jgi:hypothetical protein